MNIPTTTSAPFNTRFSTASSVTMVDEFPTRLSTESEVSTALSIASVASATINDPIDGSQSEMLQLEAFLEDLTIESDRTCVSGTTSVFSAALAGAMVYSTIAIRQHDDEISNTAPLVASVLLSGLSMATAHICYRSYKTNSAIEENQDTPASATIDTEPVDSDVSISIAMELMESEQNS